MNDNNVDQLLTRYIKDLNSQIRKEVKERITGTTRIDHFNDGCLREARDYLFMSMLLSAALKRILKNKYDYAGINKFEQVKETFQDVKIRCYYFKFPDYMELFLSN